MSRGKSRTVKADFSITVFKAVVWVTLVSLLNLIIQPWVANFVTNIYSQSDPLQLILMALVSGMVIVILALLVGIILAFISAFIDH